MGLSLNGSYKKKSLTILLGLACSISLVQAAPSSSENTQEFLSDPSRVGSLAGTILGGALTAHPAGSLAGSIVGFFVGKQSIFKSPEKEKQAQQQHAKRSIIPSAPEPVQLALTPEADVSIDTKETVPDSSALALNATIQAPLAAPDQIPAKEVAPVTPLQKIATLCQGKNNNIPPQALQNICYYRQSS